MVVLILCIIFLPSFLSGGAIYINPLDFIIQTGDNFGDSFQKLDENRWDIDLGLHCGATRKDGSRRCCLKKEDNLSILRAPPLNGTEGPTELNIMLRNDCKEPSCCWADVKGTKKCTSVTAGQITSTGMYKYGSYRFFARAISAIQPCDDVDPEPHCEKWKLRNCDQWAREGECITNKQYMHDCCKAACGVCKIRNGAYSIHDIHTCFSLHSTSENHFVMGMQFMTMCVAALMPNEIALVWQVGDAVRTKRHPLSFNAGKKNAVYRIDWYHDKIEWFVNGDKIFTVAKANFQIPDKPMYIKVYVTPRMNLPPNQVDPLVTTGQSKLPPHVELRMRLFRIRFRKLLEEPSPQDHTELFVDSSSKNLFVAKLLIFVFFLLGVLALWLNYTEVEDINLKGFYISLSQSES